MAPTIEADPEPVDALNREVPPHLARVTHLCLEKNPANRYASTRDLARDLQQVATAAPAVRPSLRHPAQREAHLFNLLLLHSDPELVRSNTTSGILERAMGWTVETLNETVDAELASCRRTCARDWSGFRS